MLKELWFGKYQWEESQQVRILIDRGQHTGMARMTKERTWLVACIFIPSMRESLLTQGRWLCSIESRIYEKRR
jgi:hypothetical protein